MDPIYTLDFSEISMRDLSRVGGKNASLGEMFNALKPKGVGVLDGFATTVEAYRLLLAENDLEERLRTIFSESSAATRPASLIVCWQPGSAPRRRDTWGGASTGCWWDWSRVRSPQRRSMKS